MDTKKLQTFVNLAQTLSYTRTAVETFTTQANVSKQIMALEKEWDVQLFSRAHRQVALSAAGAELLPLAQQVLTAATELEAKASQINLTQVKTLNVQAIPTISQYPAFKQITDFANQHSQITLNFKEAETDEIMTALQASQADVVFARVLGEIAPEYDAIVKALDYFVVLVPSNHALSKRKAVTIADLSAEKLLLLESATQLYDPLFQELRRLDQEPTITYQSKRIDLLLGMVNNGLGISLLMKDSVDLRKFPELVAVPLTPKVKSRLAFLKLKTNHQPLVQQFWKAIS